MTGVAVSYCLFVSFELFCFIEWYVLFNQWGVIDRMGKTRRCEKRTVCGLRSSNFLAPRELLVRVLSMLGLSTFRSLPMDVSHPCVPPVCASHG
jgi:hypothetical protein